VTERMLLPLWIAGSLQQAEVQHVMRVVSEAHGSLLCSPVCAELYCTGVTSRIDSFASPLSARSIPCTLVQRTERFV
jgi:hypothetical protein